MKRGKNKVAARATFLCEKVWYHIELRPKTNSEPGGLYFRKFHSRKSKAKRLPFVDALQTVLGQKLLPL